MAEKKISKKTESLAQLDKRVVDRNVQRGSVKREDLEAHLKNLPDLADQADNIADRIYGDQSIQ